MGVTNRLEQSLPAAAPSEHGVDARGVLALLDALEAADRVEPHSLMVLRHGHVVAAGWWAPYTRARAQLVYSLSKTFTSTAVGLAVADGLLSVEAPVLDYFPELAGKVSDPRSRRLLVRHLLTMASGHTHETFDHAQALDPYDVARGFLQVPPDAEPGTVFTYAQSCTFTLGSLVARVTGQGLLDYLRPRLLDPLGIGEVAWTRHHLTGQELGFSGLHARTDAVARLGQLYLQRGNWQGRQLVPAAWVDEATTPHVDNAGTSQQPDWRRGYGYQFWRSRHGYRGDGAYGQFCLVLPEHEAVVAITSATHGMQGVLDMVWEHLVPAFDGPGDAHADKALAARLQGLALPTVEGSLAGTPDWQGFRATTATVIGELSLRREDVGWVVRLGDVPNVDDGLRIEAPLGLGRWAVREGAVPVATSAAWTSPTELVVDVLFLETPHRLRLTCRLGEPVAAGEWMTEPSSARCLRDLAAPWAQK